MAFSTFIDGYCFLYNFFVDESQLKHDFERRGYFYAKSDFLY